MQKIWIAAVALALILVGAEFTRAQSPGVQSWGAGMMGGSQGWSQGWGGMMGGGMMGWGNGPNGPNGPGVGTRGQLSQEQLEQFARAHNLTVDQAKQMFDVFHQGRSGQPGTGSQQQ